MITLPLTALTQVDGKPAVWVVDPQTSKVNLRPVAIGAYREDGVTVRDGLRPGEVVVTAGRAQAPSRRDGARDERDAREPALAAGARRRAASGQLIPDFPPRPPPRGRGETEETAMSRFNLSEWALAHRSLVLYAMIVLALFGIASYTKLGQSEDPPFTFKVMVIRTGWPGATARQVEEQITDKIEKKLQEAPNVDVIQSYSKPGESFVFFRMKDSAPTSAVPETWYQVRKKIGDIRSTLPAGITGPSFNDEFGDVFGNIYALTGEGFSYADLKKYADRIRAELLRVPDVAKVEFFGEQEEKVFIELSNTKLATLGVDVPTIVNALATQNAIAPAGAFETPSDKIFLRTTGDFDSAEAIRETTIRANGRLFRIGDIARVQRGYADPPQPKMRFQGREAFGIGVAMVAGGDIIELGQTSTARSRACARSCRSASSSRR